MMNLRDLLVNEPDHRPVDPGAVSTGFLDLDTSVGGWHLGDLILVADGDQDGHMASVLACHFALTAAAQGRIPTGVVSLTTSEIQLSLELLAVHAGQDRSSVRRKMAYDAHLSRAAHHLGQLPITVRSLTAADLEELEDAILELKHDHRLVVAQGLETLTERHRLPPAHVLGRLQRLAKSLRLPVIGVVAADYFSLVDAECPTEEPRAGNLHAGL